MDSVARPHGSSAVRLYRFGPSVAVLIAFGLRVYRLGAQSLWYDEGVSLLLAGKSPTALIAHTARDIHPPLYYLLLHVWLGFAGRTEFAAAFFSVVFGVLLVAFCFRLASRLYGRRAALLTALVVAASPYNLWYSQEVRMYTLGATLALLATWLLMLMLHGETRTRIWGAYVVVSALGMYTLYYFAFLLLFHALLVLFSFTTRPETRRSLGRWLLTGAGIIVLYAPWIPVALRQALPPPVPPWRTPTPLAHVLLESWQVLVVGQSATLAQAWPLLLAAAALYGWAIHSSRHRRGPILAGHTWMPIFLIYLASFWTPLYHERYVFTFSAPFFILLGGGLDRLAAGLRWQRVMAAAIGLLVLATYALATYQIHFDSAYAADDYRAAVRYLDDQWRPGDAVLINAGYVYPMVLYYSRHVPAWRGRLSEYAGGCGDSRGPLVLQTGSVGGDPALGWGDPASDFYATTEQKTAAALQRLFHDCGRVWVLRAYDTVTDPGGFIRRWLDQNTRPFDGLTVTGQTNVRVQGFMSRGTSPTASNPLGISLGDRLLLAGSEPLPSTVVSGQPLYVTLFWQPMDALRRDYRLSLVLIGAAGRQWAVADELPGGPLFPPTRWPTGGTVQHTMRLDVPPGTPPGRYQLAVGAYDPSDARFLPVDDPVAGMEGIRAVLGELEIRAGTTPDRLPARYAHDAAHLGDAIMLAGHRAAPANLRPGEVLSVELLWQAERSPADDYTVFVQLADSAGKLWAARDSLPVDGRFPTTAWTAGQWVRDLHGLQLAADAPAGQYRLLAGLCRTSDGTRLPVRQGWLGRGDHVILGEFTVEERPHSVLPPARIAHPLYVTVGASARLLGYDFPRGETIHAGHPLTVTLYWQSTARVPRSYKVFAHLIGPDGRLWGQDDQIPGEGAFPTTGWQPGEYLTDTLTIPVAGDAAAGVYHLRVGMYDPASGARLAVEGAQADPGADSVELGPLTLP